LACYALPLAGKAFALFAQDVYDGGCRLCRFPMVIGSRGQEPLQESALYLGLMGTTGKSFEQRGNGLFLRGR